MTDHAHDAEVPKHILVGTDGSATATRAVVKAATLAKALDANLTIVSAYSRRAPGGVTVPVDDAWEARSSLAADERVGRAVEEAKAVGTHAVSGRSVAGDAADVLIDEAERDRVDLLVVGSKGLQSSARFLLGSVPNKISHNAPCDLLIVDTRD